MKSLYWINPFSPRNISMDNWSGNIQIINPETPLIVRFRPIIFPWKYWNNIYADISAHFLQMNRTLVSNTRHVSFIWDTFFNTSDTFFLFKFDVNSDSGHAMWFQFIKSLHITWPLLVFNPNHGEKGVQKKVSQIKDTCLVFETREWTLAM